MASVFSVIRSTSQISLICGLQKMLNSTLTQRSQAMRGGCLEDHLAYCHFITGPQHCDFLGDYCRPVPLPSDKVATSQATGELQSTTDPENHWDNCVLSDLLANSQSLVTDAIMGVVIDWEVWPFHTNPYYSNCLGALQLYLQHVGHPPTYFFYLSCLNCGPTVCVAVPA